MIFALGRESAELDWGLLGGEILGGTRRLRTLGLGAVVRKFNNLAVPGLGNAWYGRQLVLALLGVYIAETARADGGAVSNITTANAIEALAVWAALKASDWKRDDRLPGIRKLNRHGLTEPPPFRRAATRAFYVTQPMRISTGEALATLGFVNAPTSRFNSYSCTELGTAFLAAACPLASAKLLGWVMGGDLPHMRRPVLEDIDPTRTLPAEAREILREAVVSGSPRRRDALAWVEALVAEQSDHTSWDQQPAQITEPGHWADMHVGATFAGVIEAAAGELEGGSVLGRVETRMLARGDRRIAWTEAADAALQPALQTLRARAAAFLAADHDPSPNGEASRFCRDCTEPEGAQVLRHLVGRDGRVLRPDAESVVAGPAFLSALPKPHEAASVNESLTDPAEDEPSEAPSTESTRILPERISHRIYNLMYLAQDLRPEGERSEASC